MQRISTLLNAQKEQFNEAIQGKKNHGGHCTVLEFETGSRSSEILFESFFQQKIGIYD